jgi:hypothetical protein
VAKDELANFYEMGSKLSSSTLQVHSINLGRRNNLDDEFRLIEGDFNGIKFPVIFKQASGKKIEDILDTGWPSLYLISNKMKALLEKHDFTGWKVFQVKIFDKNNNIIPGYHGLSIVGRCGPIDQRKADIIYKRLVPHGPNSAYYKGLYVGLDAWDKTDIFIPQDRYSIIVTETVFDTIKKNKLSNIRFENLAEVEISKDAI